MLDALNALLRNLVVPGLLLCLAVPAAAQAVPTVTLASSSTTVPYGGRATLSWSATQANFCGTPWGSAATSGSYTTPVLFSPATYTITCYGPAGSQSRSVAIAVGGPPPAPTVSVSADPATVPLNSATTLTWSSTDATYCNTPWGSSAISGTHATPAITYERTFTVTCTGYGGSNAASVAVRIGAASATPAPPAAAPIPPAAPTVVLTANPASIAYNASTSLNWSSTNATSCTTPWGSNATSGQYSPPALTATTSYAVTCSGSGGTKAASVTVVVAAPPATPTPPAPPTPPTPTPTPPTPPEPATGLAVTLTASATSVAYGGTSVLTWTSANASYCAIPWGSSATSGSYTTPALFGATSYTVTCYGPAGSKSASAGIAVAGPPPAPTVSLTANPPTVANGTTTTLTWASTHANSCNTPWGAAATSGVYVTPAITYDRAFTVTCTGYGGSNAANVTVRIGAVAPTPVTTPTPTPPAPTPTPTPTPTPSPTPPVPTVTLTANPASVAYNGSSTLTWSSANASACTAPGGSTAVSGSHTTPALSATATYTVTCTGTGGSKAASATVVVAAQAGESNPPIVLNATTSGRAGDVVYLQGENFGDAPFVYLESAPSTALEIVNRVANHWLAVQIPSGAQGALVVRLRNATGTSAPVKLNVARPFHLDAIQLVPGGAFRVFGRNLLLPGSQPTITLDGLPATIDLGRSDEHMLTATAPAALSPTASTVMMVDNGNGSGPMQLDRAIEVVAGSGDPFALGVGWAAGFSDLSTRIVDAATDPRLSQKVVCDGSRDETPAIQQAVQLAATMGGGVVQLPAGRCRLAGGIQLRSRVVVQGAGKASTELVYEFNYPVFGVGLDLVGLRHLALTNAGSAREGPLLKQSTRVFLQNVRIRIGTSSQMFLDGNRNIVVAGSDFVQTGSLSHQGPYILNDSGGLVFQGNTTQWVDGAPAFGRVHDSYVQGNRFTRDGSTQNQPGTVHSFTIDFAYRIAVVGNTFDVANGPITNVLRNDGETILTEGGGTERTENLGAVASAGINTLSDPANRLMVNPFGTGYIPENYGIAIVAGKGAGQTRRVGAYSWPTVTVERPWDVVPDATSRYASFVWGLEKSLIKGNTLSQNPRGIWLYQTAMREVEVVDNTITEGGGIYLRAYQNLSTKSFTPIYNMLIARNAIRNTTGHWMSYVNAVFVNTDARPFGIATLGIEMRSNQITANQPNRESQTEEYANVEGFLNMMRLENFSNYESSATPRMLGTILSGNSCTNCNVAVRIGTGAGGTTILGTRLIGSPVLLNDWTTTPTSEKSVGTVVR